MLGKEGGKYLSGDSLDGKWKCRGKCVSEGEEEEEEEEGEVAKWRDNGRNRRAS